MIDTTNGIIPLVGHVVAPAGVGQRRRARSLPVTEASIWLDATHSAA